MGSFNATCVVSGLPITAGTKVRFLALTQNEYSRGNDHVCYVHGRWQLRTVPLRAVYNDYGSVEKIESGLAERVFFRSFEEDVIEKGLGDNSCHDVAVRTGMTPAAWLEALWEGRVFVRGGRGWSAAERMWRRAREKEMREWSRKAPAHPMFSGTAAAAKLRKSRTPPGLPTLKGIEAVLERAKFPLFKRYGDGGYSVDNIRLGYVRVRQHVFGAGVKELTPAVEAIQKAGYAAMVTCGTGNYRAQAEILVAPLPNENVFSQGLGKGVRRTSRAVSQAMVREDVWHALLSAPLEGWMGPPPTLDGYETSAKAYLAKRREALELAAKADTTTDAATSAALRLTQAMTRLDLLGEMDDPISAHLRGGEGVSGFSLRESARLALSLPYTEEELAAFALDLAETCWAETAYGMLNGQWHPSTNGGPQDTRWSSQVTFHRQIANIAKEMAVKERA